MDAARTNANVFASLKRSRTVVRATCGLLTFSAPGVREGKRSTVDYRGSNCGCKGTWRPGFGKPDG